MRGTAIPAMPGIEVTRLNVTQGDRVDERAPGLSDPSAPAQARGFRLAVHRGRKLFYGACKGQQTAENLARIEALPFEVLDFDREYAQLAGELRAMLAGAGAAPIGPCDILIAGQARARGLILVTHDTREFLRVPQIRVEDWEA